MVTIARESATNAERIISRDVAAAKSSRGWSAVGGALEQAVADTKLALARPRHLFHGINHRRFLAERERHFAFAFATANAHAHRLSRRAPANPAVDIAWHLEAVDAQDRVRLAKAHLRCPARKIEIGHDAGSGGTPHHTKPQSGALLA